MAADPPPAPAAPPDPGAVLAVAPGVLWARMPLPFRLDHVNIHFIEDDGGWLILDTGIDSPQARAQWRTLLDGPLRGARFTGLIASHSHPDHIGLAGWLCRRLEIPLLTTRISFLGSTMIARAPDIMASPDYARLYSRHGMSDEIAALVATRGHEYLGMISDLPSAYTRLSDGGRLRIGGRSFEIIGAEGHCPGQIMLHDPAGKLLFAADHLIERISPNVSVQPYEPDDDPLGAFLAGHAAIRHRIAPDALVLSGHHLPFGDPHRRAGELIAHHRARLSALLSACHAAPRPAADLVPVLFPRPLTPHEMSFAFTEVLAHLNHLAAEGRIGWRQDARGRLLAAAV